MTEKTGETPLNGIFFLLSFFFCSCYGQKEKLRCPFADIISVHEMTFLTASLVQREVAREA